MQLQATTAREIDKATITDDSVLVLYDTAGRQVASSGEYESMKPGDYYLRPNVIAHATPATWWRRVFLRQQAETITHEVAYSIAMSCPVCGMALITSPSNTVLSKHPLTLNKPIGCGHRAPAALVFGPCSR